MSVKFAKLFALLAGVLEINTTFAFEGKIPVPGKGRIMPPPVIVAFTEAMKAGFVHNPFQVLAAVGQVTFIEEVFKGLWPT